MVLVNGISLLWRQFLPEDFAYFLSQPVRGEMAASITAYDTWQIDGLLLLYCRSLKRALAIVKKVHIAVTRDG